MTDPRETLVELLRGRVLRGLQAGTLQPGDRLPSARDLAPEFEVDHRLVIAAYRRLAEEGIVEMRTRGGVYVAMRPIAASGLPPIPESWLVETLVGGFVREIAAPELHEWLRRCVETLRIRAAVVTSTTDQAAGLCRELRDDFGVEASGFTAAETERELPVELRRADLLVATEAHADAVREIGRRLDKPVFVIELRPSLSSGEWALLLRRPVWAVVASDEFGQMLRRFFDGVDGVENLRVLVLGRDDLSSIPDGAPVYLTQRARAQLGDAVVGGRILPAARTISAASARAIFTFIVHANVEALRRRPY